MTEKYSEGVHLCSQARNAILAVTSTSHLYAEEAGKAQTSSLPILEPPAHGQPKQQKPKPGNLARVLSVGKACADKVVLPLPCDEHISQQLARDHALALSLSYKRPQRIPGGRPLDVSHSFKALNLCKHNV